MRSTLILLALAGTCGLLLCGDASAQRGNRGNGGARPNAYPGYNSGYNFGSNNLGGYRGGFGNGSTLGTILGYGSQGQYYNNGNGYYYPSTSGYGYSYPSQGTTYYTTPSVGYSTPGVVYAPGTIVQGSPAYDTSTVPTMMPAASTTGKAVIEVTVPTADAKVLFGTTLVDMPGRERRYESSEIALGQNFTYTITARWMNDGKPMEQVQVVDVMAGKTSKATFRNEDATRQLPPTEQSGEK